jgi:hypothetical protein
LRQETNSNITSFTYPIQIILSPNIRDSSLFFLDVELTFAENPPGLIFDVVGPFTILPIPEAQQTNETANKDQDNFSGRTKEDNGSDNSSQDIFNSNRYHNSAGILMTGVDWTCVMLGMILAISHIIGT